MTSVSGEAIRENSAAPASWLFADAATLPLLRTKQVSAFKQMAPLLLGLNAVALVLAIALLPDTSLYSKQALWMAGLAQAVLAGCVTLYLMQSRPMPDFAHSRTLFEAVIFCGIFGALYGLMPAAWIVEASGASGRTATLAAVAGVAALGALALSVLPAAAFAFLGAFGGVFIPWMWFHGTFGETGVAMGGLAALFFVAGVSGMRELRGFRANIRRERTIREQRLIIGMLLKEFEPEESNWLWEFDPHCRLTRVSTRFASVSEAGHTLSGANFFDFLRSTSDGGSGLEKIENAVMRRQMFSDIELRLAINGRERWWRMTGKPLFDEKGIYAGYIGAAADITEEKTSENKIAFLAHNDPLTGLANRAKFTEALNQCVARLERYGTPFTVLYLDLDQFKLINDSRGHLVGDRLLTIVGQRLRREMRETDLVARVGGDEFAILLPEENDQRRITGLTDRLIAAISAPYDIDGEIASIGLSVGVALAPNNGTRANQVLRNADLALYRAKEDGRGVARFFEMRMDSDNRERRLLENEMRQALEAGEFELYFQPVVGTESKNPVGFEALVRWNHPIRGMVPPSEFIPIAEQTGLICEIGDWTVQEACRTAATWPNDLTVAVNLSAKHFQTSDIVTVVSSALSASGLKANRLEIEVTESLLIKNQEEVRDKLSKLRELGTTIALDDFGTGYSSLSYLLKFPFDKIKIDKSFVDASSTDDVARDILRTIAALGSTLQMKVTAEGVETIDQVEFLREIACHHLQGYFFARPLKSSAVAPYLLHSAAEEMKNAEVQETGKIHPLRKAG